MPFSNSSIRADKHFVERRKEPRLHVNESVMLLVLGPQGTHPIEGCVVDLSNNGVQVRVPGPVPLDTVIKIDGLDALILGKVCHCRPDLGAYRLGIQLSTPLPSLMELELLNRALIGQRPTEFHQPPEVHKGEVHKVGVKEDDSGKPATKP
jgi:hypothetical protein